jgi:hypothetical protein
MSRRPLDQTSQRELIDELRLLLDHICLTECGHVRCEDNTMRVWQLIEANPRSVFSTKVTYNIGRARAARVRTMHEASRARAGASLPIRRKRLVGES